MIKTISTDAFQQWKLSKQDILDAKIRTCTYCLIGKMDKRKIPSPIKPRKEFQPPDISSFLDPPIYF